MQINRSKCTRSCSGASISWAEGIPFNSYVYRPTILSSSARVCRFASGISASTYSSSALISLSLTSSVKCIDGLVSSTSIFRQLLWSCCLHSTSRSLYYKIERSYGVLGVANVSSRQLQSKSRIAVSDNCRSVELAFLSLIWTVRWRMLPPWDAKNCFRDT